MRDVARAVERRVRQLRRRLFLEIGRERRHMRVILVEMRHADLARLGKRRDVRQRLGARADALFLPAAEHQGRQAQALFDIQRADALGRADLVAGNAHQVAVPFFRRQFHAGKPLHRVDVEQRAGRFGAEHRAELRDRLHRADLVVDQLAGEQDGVRGQRLFERRRGDVAGLIRREEHHVEPLCGQLFAGVHGRRVLDRRGDDAALFVATQMGGAAQADVGALRAAGGKIGLLGQAAERRGHGLAAVLEQMRRLDAHFVQARRVAERLAHGAHGGLRRLGQHLRRRRIVQIMHGR